MRIAGCIAAALVAGSLSPFVVADSAKAERGRYLVQIAGCNDCHTPGYASRQGKVDEKRWLTGDALGFQGQDLAAIYHYIRTLGAAGPIAPVYAPPGQAVTTPVVKFPE